ncbi:isocitrate dehydrogenase [NAD] subunit gamma, mitochondrial-like isoform X2 [Symsagittifera roscoffensis]|uniref:isocitrate dehydrogenase [NAD] subunit gamma, mitochondrial-like isoform X2 n=1 Tax=Symsagittifera roscoffensis TaxID=84072 RepID=UPI00307BD8CE
MASSKLRALLRPDILSRVKTKMNFVRAMSSETLLPPTIYGGQHVVTAVPGDGIGPEMLEHVKTIFKHLQVPVTFEEVHVGHEIETADLDMVLESIKRNRVALKGNLETHKFREGYFSKNHYIRERLDLFASVTRCHSIQGVPTRHKNVDIVVIRENTEGEYSMLEHQNVPGVVESLKVITRNKCTRIAKYAFDYAKSHGRHRITAIHKANIMKQADGLFLECCREVSKSYPEIEFDAMIVDNTAMQLVSRPDQFDVMLTPNLYGNVIVAMLCGLTGGPGLTPSYNLGHYYKMFETATRNSGKSLAGQNVANPVAYLRAAAEMLKHLQLPHHSTLINKAIFKVVADGKIRTADIGGQNTTNEVVDAILSELPPNPAKMAARA